MPGPVTWPHTKSFSKKAQCHHLATALSLNSNNLDLQLPSTEVSAFFLYVGKQRKKKLRRSYFLLKLVAIKPIQPFVFCKCEALTECQLLVLKCQNLSYVLMPYTDFQVL